MKKTVKLLSNRELREFESIYQLFKNFPGWEMDKLFSEKTFEYEECDKCSRVFYISKKHKPNRLIVAAHEAGHAIVMVATHRYVGEVIIDVKDHPKGRIGWVKPQGHTDAKDDKPIEQEDGMPCKPIVKMDILLKAGGFVGESLIGKKTGSNHERFLVYCRCRYLDELDEVEPLTNWTHYVEWCRKIILNNENLFWKATDDLLANSQMTERVKILLNSSVKQEPTELFFN